MDSESYSEPYSGSESEYEPSNSDDSDSSITSNGNTIWLRPLCLQRGAQKNVLFSISDDDGE